MAIWHNGTLSETASIDASSAGLLLGWGVFTTIGIKAGRPLWLDHHIARLRRDATRCDIAIPFSDSELSEALAAVVHANATSDGLARLTATRRDDGRWNTDTATDVTILALESHPAKSHNLRVGFAEAPSQGLLSGVKTTSYLPYLWHWQEAQKSGWDEVVLLQNGFIAEASRSSLFWVKNGVLQTAPLSLGVLEGIGRDLVLEWAKANDIQVQTLTTALHDWLSPDEAFLISAATGPRAISSLCIERDEIFLSGSSPIFEDLRLWWNNQ